MAAQSPYLKPSIPFTGSIYGGLRDGMTVIVCGTARQCCERFKIDFQCGFAPLPQADVAFHCNPRFDEGCVVANSFEKGKWQCEERTREMPFRRGYPFEVRFHVNNISFKVDVDGRYLLEFKHRIALSRVDAVSISGDVEVAFIYFQSPTVRSESPWNLIDKWWNPGSAFCASYDLFQRRCCSCFGRFGSSNVGKFEEELFPAFWKTRRRCLRGKKREK